jgi:hypothetical protein
MQHRKDFPDDIPVADAVEQERAVSEPDLDDDASAESPPEWPLEAAGADWQEQLDTVDLDPDEGRSDA